jgi:hypothetical protein
MEVSDFISMIVGLGFVIYLVGRHFLKERYRREHPKEAALDDQKRREALKRFLKALEGDMEDLEEEEEKPVLRPVVKKAVPPPPPPPKPASHRRVADEFRFQTRVEQQRLQTAVEQRQFKTAVESRPHDYGANLISQELRLTRDAYAHALVQKCEPSRGQTLISRLSSKKEMVILQEMLNPPKGLDERARKYF